MNVDILQELHLHATTGMHGLVTNGTEEAASPCLEDNCGAASHSSL